MNATKRKFNTLLQGIGTRPSTSVASADRDDAARASLGTVPNDGTQRPTDALIATPSHRQSSTTTVATPTSTTPGLSAAAAKLEYLAKKRRVGPSSGVKLGDTAGQPKMTTSSDLLRKWGTPASAQTSTATPAQPPAPRYCPGDREQLLRRLATFQELTDWTPKPDGINEIAWAKRGWVCQGKERLRCTLCSKELVVRLGGRAAAGEGDAVDGETASTSERTAGDTADALAATYADLVVTAHEEDCLWRKKGCDDHLLRLPLANPRQAVADLRQRYDELCARKDFLPYEFNLRLPVGLDVDAVLATLPPDFGDTESMPVNRVALALAILGWQGLHNARIGPVPNSASCHACLRRLGLWMFKSKQVDLATNTVLEPAPMDHLDAVREHRFFCPWKNGAVQRNPGGGRMARRDLDGGDDEDVSGWRVLVQLLRNDTYLRNRVATQTTAVPAETKMPSKRPETAGGAASEDVADTVAQPPATPERRLTTAATAATVATDGTLTITDHDDADGGEAARTAKDKERWARLRRVKSLFDSKGTTARKLRRANSSRPGTSHSVQSVRPGGI